jgi:hypothetical protein
MLCRPKWLPIGGLGLALLVASCGPENPLGRKAIYGAVTLDGAPLQEGAIEFHPLVQGGVQSGALVKAGSYSIPAHQGATLGKYRVVIYDTYETPPLPPGHMPGDDLPRPPKPKVPPEWNSNSQNTIEVTDKGPYRFNFDIVTKKR